MENETLATEMLKELKANSKRWFIAFMISLILWFLTIGIFIWYINQPIEETTTMYSQDAETEGESSPIDQKIGEWYYGKSKTKKDCKNNKKKSKKKLRDSLWIMILPKRN